MIYIIIVCTIGLGQSSGLCSATGEPAFSTADDCRQALAVFSARYNAPLEYRFGPGDRLANRYACVGRPTWSEVR